MMDWIQDNHVIFKFQNIQSWYERFSFVSLLIFYLYKGVLDFDKLKIKLTPVYVFLCSLQEISRI